MYVGLAFWLLGGFVSEWSESCGGLALQYSDEPERPHHLSKVNNIIAFILNLERPVIFSVLKVDEECRSIDLDVHPYELTYVLRRRQSDMNYADVFHVDSGGPSMRKLPAHLSAVFHVPPGVETWIRQGQELLVIAPHEVHECLLPWGDASASGTPVFPECDVGTQVVDQNEPRTQGDHFSQLVLSKSLSPRQADVDLLHLLFT